MGTKGLNPKKYVALINNINDQALEECKELLRSKGDKCFIYITRSKTNSIVELIGDDFMDMGELVGVGVEGDNLLYCAFSYNDLPQTTEDAWQSFGDGYSYMSSDSISIVYEFIVRYLNKSVTKEEAVAAQKADYEGNQGDSDWGGQYED